MSMSVALMLALLPAADDRPNLDFADGRTTHWKGGGFSVVPLVGLGRRFGVSSADEDGKPRKGLLHRTFVVPPGAGTLHCRAYASSDDENLNVILEAAERAIVPKCLVVGDNLDPSPRLRPAAEGGTPREYVWSIADRVGETLRIIVVDQSDRPGRHVVCSGFHLEPLDHFETRSLKAHLERLVREHKLPALSDPYRSKHFLAVGNTDEKFIQAHLERCELMHRMFLNHFRVKEFKLTQPTVRLTAAVFSSQEGFEAYLGGPVPSGVTGLYHPPSNRLVIYDFGRSRVLTEEKKRIEDRSKQLGDLERSLVLGRVHREADELRTDANISTLMHEVAHQMSFNTGLLNRHGDLPLWLAEGIATYCEPTENGFWKGIGESNPERLKPLRRAISEREKLLPLRMLVESDQWLHGPGGGGRALMGYAQSWALVRMLMEEQPKTLRRYCETIHNRRTPDHRLTDFLEAFGSDLDRMEKRHREYVRRIAAPRK